MRAFLEIECAGNFEMEKEGGIFCLRNACILFLMSRNSCLAHERRTFLCMKTYAFVAPDLFAIN